MTTSQLALALDVKSPEELFMWSETFQGLPVILKIGLRLLPKLQKKDFDALKDQDFKLFIDTKLHDIPSQVSDAVETWGALGADYLTLHLSGGPQMLKGAAAAAKKSGVELLGVSVLTSLGASDLTRMGFTYDPAKQVEKLVRLGLESGLTSFVCSVNEAPLIQKIARDDFLGVPVRTVCPGLRLAGGVSQPDQNRTFTVDEAIRAGVGMLVVGRAVFEDANPRARVEEILGKL